jgi:hypothetical protein
MPKTPQRFVVHSSTSPTSATLSPLSARSACGRGSFIVARWPVGDTKTETVLEVTAPT